MHISETYNFKLREKKMLNIDALHIQSNQSHICFLFFACLSRTLNETALPIELSWPSFATPLIMAILPMRFLNKNQKHN
tara:strand:+ start:83 stop:319 length:237 start_codon:yes stop_codon:yes gene_type:complete